MSWLSGELKSWIDEKGYGFIKPHDGGHDVFLHISDLKKGCRPCCGNVVFYHLVIGKEGKPRACNAFLKGQYPVGERFSKYTKNKPKEPEEGTDDRKFDLGIFDYFMLLIPMAFSVYFLLRTFNPTPLMIYLVMSLVTFIAYGKDKNKAQRQTWRTSENTLHCLEFLGGWPGARLAHKKIRHKNKKPSFQSVFWMIVFLHLSGWVGVLILLGIPENYSNTAWTANWI